MSTKIHFDPFHNQIISQKFNPSYSRRSYVHFKKINKPLNFLNSNAKIGTFIVRCNSANSTGSEASLPGKSPSSEWKKWLLGFFLPILLPAFKNKVSPLQLLKSNVDKALKTVETMTEIVEEVAEEVEKVAEEVEKKLPGDSKFKESLDSIENLAKGAVKYANQAQDIIHKVVSLNLNLDLKFFTLFFRRAPDL
ncbi:uncharacterized protein LOC107871972 isoform X2 [Capsicum annuum]|uniref:uncharacterized protein LOC107871972 isoform X2 n=1 Tax=Capsicum annuum TaxID=4072 RepID=UPI001FB0A2FA|nr:uncharacterized protein LOC107871972 isoform X2 [Capsicum annuum]